MQEETQMVVPSTEYFPEAQLEQRAFPAPVQVAQRRSHFLLVEPSRKKLEVWSEQEATQVREVFSTEYMLVAQAWQAALPDPVHSLQVGHKENTRWLQHYNVEVCRRNRQEDQSQCQ